MCEYLDFIFENLIKECGQFSIFFFFILSLSRTGLYNKHFITDIQKVQKDFKYVVILENENKL